VPVRPAARFTRHGSPGGFPVAFAVPFLFADLPAIDRDLFCGLYATAVAGLLALWAHDLIAAVKRHWPSDLARPSRVLAVMVAGPHGSAVLHSYDTDAFLPPHEAAELRSGRRLRA
jgi:hypothetical protein